MERKVQVGYCSTSKKSAERRWPSRSGLPVLIEPGVMVSAIEEADGLAVSTWAVPSNSPNWPRTLVTMAWRAVKPSREWEVSMV